MYTCCSWRNILDTRHRALDRAKVKPGTEAQARSSANGAPAQYEAPSRRGKVPITAYLSPDYKASFRLIQAKTDRSLQDLIAEAFDDLFVKHGVPMLSE
jgi:hypothetical protein